MQMATVGYFMQLLSMENWYHPVAGSTSWFSLTISCNASPIQTTLSLKMAWWTGNPGKGAKRKQIALTQKPLQLCKTFITKYQHLSSFMDRSAQVGPPSLLVKSRKNQICLRCNPAPTRPRRTSRCCYDAALYARSAKRCSYKKWFPQKGCFLQDAHIQPLRKHLHILPSELQGAIVFETKLENDRNNLQLFCIQPVYGSFLSPLWDKWSLTIQLEAWEELHPAQHLLQLHGALKPVGWGRLSRLRLEDAGEEGSMNKITWRLEIHKKSLGDLKETFSIGLASTFSSEEKTARFTEQRRPHLEVHLPLRGTSLPTLVEIIGDASII